MSSTGVRSVPATPFRLGDLPLDHPTIVRHSLYRLIVRMAVVSSMSSVRSAFSSLKSDRRPIRLADGRVIYSEGLGSIRFLSDCGYVITIERCGYVID